MISNRVSVIVPVYKVENELDRCIRSILNQSYTNLEIILVDDGSPDRCPQICDSYAAIDSRVNVIHKKNGGLSDARNAGLSIASGDYLAFVDSDDWISKYFIEYLLTALVDTNSDIAIGGYTLINEAGKKRSPNKNHKKIEILEHEDALRELFAQKKYECTICTKLYRKEVFNGIKFPKGKLYEDIAVSLPLFDRIHRCVVINDELYFYFQRKTSIVNSKFTPNKLDMLEFIKKMIDYSHSHSHKYDLEVEAFYLKALLSIIIQLYKDENPEYIKNFSKLLKKELWIHKCYIFNNKFIELRRKIVMGLILSHFPISMLVKLWKLRMRALYE